MDRVRDSIQAEQIQTHVTDSSHRGLEPWTTDRWKTAERSREFRSGLALGRTTPGANALIALLTVAPVCSGASEAASNVFSQRAYPQFNYYDSGKMLWILTSEASSPPLLLPSWSITVTHARSSHLASYASLPSSFSTPSLTEFTLITQNFQWAFFRVKQSFKLLLISLQSFGLFCISFRSINNNCFKPALVSN